MSDPRQQSTASEKNNHVPSHILPYRTYLFVYGALLILTGITVEVSLLHLGNIAIYVAMAVAIVKAALVVTVFMHLKYENPLYGFIFLVSLLFLALFMVFTMIDLTTRGRIDRTEQTFTYKNERTFMAWEEALKKKQALLQQQKQTSPATRTSTKPAK